MLDIHPIITTHPHAAFIVNTDLESMDDRSGFLRWGRRIGGQIFVNVPGEQTQKVVLKPNITVAPGYDENTQEIIPGQEGIVTDPYFVAGLADSLRELGAERIIMAEGGGGDPITRLLGWGYDHLMAERGIEVVDLNSPEFTESSVYSDFNWVHVDGVVFKDIPFVPPINDSDALLVNVPTLKTHNLTGFSLSVKNLQGMLPNGYVRGFCGGVDRVDGAPDFVRKIAQPDARERVTQLMAQHRAEGYKDWEDEGQSFRNEGYCARALDCLSAAKVRLHLVEGIRSRDGSGFRQGTDHLTNLVVFGTDAISVDAVSAYLIGHNPEEVGYMRIGRERGLGENRLSEIEIYWWNDGTPDPVEDPTALRRYSLGAYLHGDSSKAVFF